MSDGAGTWLFILSWLLFFVAFWGWMIYQFDIKDLKKNQIDKWRWESLQKKVEDQPSKYEWECAQRDIERMKKDLLRLQKQINEKQLLARISQPETVVELPGDEK